MKPGDLFPVMLEGLKVAAATVEEIDDDRVTLIIPQTRVVMGMRSTLTDLDPEVDRILIDALAAKPEPLKPEDVSNVSLRSLDLDSSAVDVDKDEE